MKRTASDAITKFYADKGFRNVKVTVRNKKIHAIQNYCRLYFNVDKGQKVKIAEINFVNNTVSDDKLKGQMKGKREKPSYIYFLQKTERF